MTILALMVCAYLALLVVSSVVAAATVDSGPDWLNTLAFIAIRVNLVAAGVAMLLLVLAALGLRVTLA